MMPALKLGQVVYFRYTSPTTINRVRNVIVMAGNYQQALHGLELRYMTPQQQNIVQWFFLSVQRQQTEPDPVLKIKQDFERQREQYEQNRQQMLSKQTGVIITPAKDPMNKTPFGVKTFGRTQTNAAQATPQQATAFGKQTGQIKPGVYPKIDVDDETYNRATQFLNSKEVETQFNPVVAKQIPTNPYQFYHYTLKALFGTQNIRKFYRQYKLQHVYNLRFLRM